MILLHQNHIIYHVCVTDSVPWDPSYEHLVIVFQILSARSFEFWVCVRHFLDCNPHLPIPSAQWTIITHKHDVFLVAEMRLMTHHPSYSRHTFVCCLLNPQDTEEHGANPRVSSWPAAEVSDWRGHCASSGFIYNPCAFSVKHNTSSASPEAFPGPLLLTFLAGVVLRPSRHRRTLGKTRFKKIVSNTGACYVFPTEGY